MTIKRQTKQSVKVAIIDRRPQGVTVASSSTVIGSGRSIHAEIR